jgi:hypothetical protein
MQPIVINMGLDWISQQTKLADNYGPVMEEITTTGGDGKPYSMACLPLSNLATWFDSISPSNVAPELLDKFIQYQEGCDDALCEHWSDYRERYLLLLQKRALDLAKWLDDATGRFERHTLYHQLQQLNGFLGLPTPPLPTISGCGADGGDA